MDRHPGRGTTKPGVDTIKTLARDRHFFTADVHLADYGRMLVIGDQKAVKRLLAIIKEHAEHELIALDLDESESSEHNRP